MSGSKKKLIRKEEQLILNETDGPKLGKPGKTKLIIAAIVAVAALIVAFLILLGAGAVHRTATAMSVGSVKYSSAEYNLAYFTQVNNYVTNITNYGYSALDLGLDVTKPLDKQPYPGSDKGQTWDEYFRDKTNSYLKQAAELYLEAKAAGTILPDSFVKEVDGNIDSIRTYCETTDTPINEYLIQKYGEGVNENVVRSFLERMYLASYYSSEKTKSFDISDAEISDYYNANKADFDVVDYRAFYFDAAPAESTDGSTADAQGAVTEDSMAQAKQKADKMCSLITDDASFIMLAQENAEESEKETYADPGATLNLKAASTQMSDEIKTYLFDDARKPGDKAVIASDTYYTVVFMIRRYRPDEPTVNVRHILIMPEVSEGANEATDEQKAAAKSTVEQIYEEWKNGEATEESFAKLAGEKTEDPGSAANGGLYENVYHGQMDTNFDEWCFDSSRKTGDTDIVETVYGYHIMYFSGRAEDYWAYQVKSVIANNEFGDYLTTLEDKYKLKEHSIGMKLTGKN